MADDLDNLERKLAELTQRVSALEPTPATKATQKQGSEKDKRVEDQLTHHASYWFARLGIISLVTGIAFFVADSYAWLGAPLKVLLGYAIATCFVLVGRRVAHQSLSGILIAGGLGVAYYTTYAMHYVPSAQLITSPAVAFCLLAIMVVFIVSIAHHMQSETVAGVALFLGLHTGMVSSVGSFTLMSGVLLAIGSAFFLAKNRWVYVPISTLVAVYYTHVMWILSNPLLTASSQHDPAHLQISVAFAAIYFVTFSIALVLAAPFLRKQLTCVFALLNWSALLLILCYEYDFHGHPGLYLALLVLAGALAVLAFAAKSLRPAPTVFELHIALCTITLAIAAGVGVSENQLGLTWAGLALSASAIAVWLSMPRLATLASIILAMTYLSHLGDVDNLAHAGLFALATLVQDRLHREFRDNRLGLPHPIAHPIALAFLALITISASAPAKLIVLLWLASALALLSLGLLLRDLGYRLVAFGLLVLGFARLFLVDMASIASAYRIAAFLLLGATLLAISYGYSLRSATPRAARKNVAPR